MSTIAFRRFMQGFNYYVPAQQAASDLGQGLNGRFSLGVAITAASAALILSAQAITAAVDTTTFAGGFANTEAQMGRYGRIVQVVASGAATSTVDVYGRDYLGQKIRETLTLNGTTPVIGKKAFRYIDRVVAGITNAVTFNLGTGTGFGLPYVTIKLGAEFQDNVLDATGPALTAPIFTDPQTATTGDPRGTVIPHSTPNGARVIELIADFTNYVNTSSNGGMHGIQHIGA